MFSISNSLHFKYLTSSALSQAANKVLTFSNSIIVIYLSSKHLSQEEIGIFLSIMSLVGILFIFDFGIGSAISNVIMHKPDGSSNKKISSLMTASIAQTLLITIILYLICDYLNPLKIFRFSSKQLELETLSSIKTYILAFGFIIIAVITEKVYLTRSRATFFYMYSNLVQIASMISIFILLNNESTISKIITISIGLPYFLISLLGFSLCFTKGVTLKSIYIELKNEFYALTKISPKFLVISLGILMAFGIDPYLISYTTNFSATSEYSILQRIFQVIIIPIMIINSPLLAIYHSLYIKKEFHAAQKILRIILSLILACSALYGLFIYFFGNSISTSWTNKKIILGSTMIVAYSIKSILEGLMISLTNYYNAINVIKKQYIFSTIIILFSVPLKLFLLYYLTIPFALITYSFFYITTYFIIFKRKVAGIQYE
jgi:O-antigen/teichoic acid export membrane protein